MPAKATVPVFMRVGTSGDMFKAGEIEFDINVTGTEARAEPLDLPGFLRAMADEIENARQEDAPDAPA
ncbi:hypothetical protein [Streptomyces sp. V1I1]|uniref:hypothetical protein n=1 Tax=Streptomyces sp. V1I1 TaxID=3042272 RepID=UPI002785EFDA|nr:hypothetical protein [Streptomyces sp. V1I1]MDQ0943280.1 hypothetical protein [Streptomyces sp. V1I1]